MPSPNFALAHAAKKFKRAREWQSCHPNVSARNNEHKSPTCGRLESSQSPGISCFVHVTRTIFHSSFVSKLMRRRRSKKRRNRRKRRKATESTIDLVLPYDLVQNNPLQQVPRIRERPTLLSKATQLVKNRSRNQAQSVDSQTTAPHCSMSPCP